MNIQEAFKLLRDAVEWLFDALDLNNRENPPMLNDLRTESLKLIPMRSDEELARYTVTRMVGRLCGGSNFTISRHKDIENSLRNLYLIFGGDGPDAGMTRLSDEEYNDNSDLTLSEHLEALNKTAIQFEWLERDSVLRESDLWNNLARSAKIDRPEMSVWITSINRATKSLRDWCYFEDLKRNRSLSINNELQDIYSVYRVIKPHEERK